MIIVEANRKRAPVMRSKWLFYEFYLATFPNFGCHLVALIQSPDFVYQTFQSTFIFGPTNWQKGEERIAFLFFSDIASTAQGVIQEANSPAKE